MQRIILPLAIIAVIYYTPLFAVEQSSDAFGTTIANQTGSIFLANAADCLMGLQVPLGEECSYDGEFYGSPMVGHLMTWAALLGLGAGALGIIGLLPLIGRLTSIVTVVAGLAALGAIGAMTLTLLGTDDGLSAIRWGAYLTAGIGLLTVITGLGGIRGKT